MSRRLALILVAGSLVASACTGATTETTPPADDGGDPLPTTTTTIGGESYAGTDPAPEFPEGLDWLNIDQPLSMEQLKGKIVLLDFWTYGCINCIHIIPDLKRLEAEYEDQLVVIGVHSAKFANEGETANIREVIQRYDVVHPVVNDRDFTVWRTWGASAWPTVVLIDPAGNIVGGRSGEGVYETFQPVIASLAAEFASSIDPTPLATRLEKDGRAEGVLSYPGKVAVDSQRRRLYVADTNHHRIVVADLDTGEVIGVAGTGEAGYSDGDASAARFDQPQGMALLADGSGVYVADTGNHAIRRFDFDAGTVETIAGTGRQATRYPPLAGAIPMVDLTSPWDVLLSGDSLFVAMAGSHQIWEIDLETGLANGFAGTGGESTKNGARLGAELAQPSGLAFDGSRLYFADSESSSIRWVDVAPDGDVGLLVGADDSLFDFGDVDGTGADARLQHPLGVALDGGGKLFVADTYNSKIKVVDLATSTITTLAGGQGWRDGAEPLFYEPGGLTFADGLLYVADTNNHVIRTVDPATGQTNTMVLYGIERFSRPEGYGGKVVVADPVEVAAGEGQVAIEVALPSGYKLNDTAPLVLEWSFEGDAITVDPATFSAVEPSFPLLFAATFVAGEAEATAELVVYYCEAERQELCLIEQVRITVPVTVTAGGASDVVRFEHTIPAPDF